MKTLARLTIITITILLASTVFAQTYVSGIISSNTNWTLSGSPYIVIGGVLVSSGVTLTIEPGVEVKFDSELSLQIDGEIVAIGTESNMITFTSNQISPAAGDWGYILFTDSSTNAIYDPTGNYTSGCILEYCIVEYAGGTVQGAVRVENSGPFIKNTIISDNLSVGVFSSSGNLQISDCLIESNTNSSCGGGIKISGGSIDLLNTNIRNNISGSCYQYYYYVGGGGIYINNVNATISNCNIEYNSSSGCGAGIFFANGIVILSYNDIMYNNGNGICCISRSGSLEINNNVIAKNQGKGIYIPQTTQPPPVKYITDNVISDNNGTGIEGCFQQTQISGNTITFNIADIPAVSFWFDPCTFEHNTIVGNVSVGNTQNICIGVGTGFSSFPIITNNNIFGNDATYIIYNYNSQGSPNINATNNWWGTTSESEIQTMIYDWFDDSSLGIVDYSPYLTTPDTIAPPIPPIGMDTLAVWEDSVSIFWLPSPIGDLAGYKVYFDSDLSGFPYSDTVDVGLDTTHTLTNLTIGTTYYISVTCYDNSGEESWYSREIEVIPGGVGVDENVLPLHKSFYLSQNYPNPFNPETTISFSIPQDSKVELSIYNIKGQKVKILAKRDFEKGIHKVIWNGKDENGKPISSGIYFYKIKVKDKMISKKMLLLK